MKILLPFVCWDRDNPCSAWSLGYLGYGVHYKIWRSYRTQITISIKTKWSGCVLFPKTLPTNNYKNYTYRKCIVFDFIRIYK